MEMTTTITGPAQAEVTLSGRSISPGLGMGRAWVVGDVLKWTGPSVPIAQKDVAGELLRLTHSVEETLAELDQYAKRIEVEFDSTLAGIFRRMARCCGNWRRANSNVNFELRC